MKNTEQSERGDRSDKELELLNRILKLEKNLSEKTGEQKNFLKKIEELTKSNNELKINLQKATRDQTGTKVSNFEYENEKQLRIEYEEKYLKANNNYEEIIGKYKKVQTNYKNVRFF